MSSWIGLPAIEAVTFDVQPQRLVIALVDQLGLFAIVILLCSVLDRRTETIRPALRQVVLGSVFGVSAIAAMLAPLTLGSGVFIDSRSVMIALSGFFGGPISAVTAVLVGALYRMWVGGAGALPACASMAGVAACGVLISRAGRPSQGIAGLPRLLLLALAVGCVTTAAMSVLPIAPDLLRRVTLPLLLTNTIGIVLLGLALGEQGRRRTLQRALAMALDSQRELAERHRIITDNVADGIVTFDESGVIQSFNSSAEWIFGFIAEDVVGQHVAVLMTASGSNEHDTVIHHYLKTGKAQVIGADGAVTGRRRGGSTFPMELRIAELRLNGRRYFTASVRDLTRRKAADNRRAEAEASLRNSEARFRDCARASSDYLWETDAEHRFNSCEGGATLANLYRDALIGRTRWEVAGADSSEDPWRRHLAALEDRQPFRNFVFSMVGADGKPRWIRSSGVPFFDEAGRFAGYRGASSNITDAVEAQSELQARAQQQQALATLGRLALEDSGQERLFATAFDVLTKCLDVPMAGLFDKASGSDDLVLTAGSGWREDDYGTVSVPCSSARLPAAAFAVADPVTQRSLTEDDAADRSEFGRRYGIMSGMAAGIGDMSRRVATLVVYATEPRSFKRDEVSFFQALAFILGAAIERRRAEASLQLRDRALEAIGQGLVISDATVPGTPAVYMNSVFERSREGGPARLLGRSLGELFVSDDDPAIDARIVREIRDKGYFSGRTRTKSARGDAWEDITITRLCDQRGALTHLVSVQTDVTHRVNMEAELLQAQKMDAVGKLTGGVAHDFNNLLTVILGNAELLAEDLTDPQAKQSAEMILDAAERGSDLVQRLLAFGRRQALQPEALDLDAAVASLAALLRRTIGQGIVLRTELESRGLTAFIDKSHLETAILNLVTNARDAMKGGGTLTISTRSVEIGPDDDGLDLKPGRYLSLVVADTGSGMPPDVRERVFEPFFTTKDLGKGTGLGLSTVYGFVQQSGGHIHIDTGVGRGTKVIIHLPLATGAAAQAADGEARTVQVGGERVLLVEDQEDVRNFVTAQLTSFGYDVVSASTGPDAIKRLNDDPEVRLLFTDILLPAGLDGIELAERALASRPNLKVLFTSGYSDYVVERRSRLLERGIPLLKKPYRRLELATAMREALERPAVH